MSNLPQFEQDPREPSFVQDPYPAYERMRALGPLCYWTDYGLICTTSVEIVDAVFRDRRFVRVPPPHLQKAAQPHLTAFQTIEDHSLLELEPPQHSEIRSRVLRAFTSRSIAELKPWIKALCDRLADDFPDGEFDLLRAYAEPIPVRVITRILGVPENMGPQLLEWSHAMVAMYQARRDRDIENRAEIASVEFTAFIRAQIAEKSSSDGDDLLSRLVNAQSDRLSDAQIVSTTILLLNAGHEATVHAIANGVLALASRSAVSDAHFDSAADTEKVVNEVLRFDPPLHMFTRYASTDMSLAGHQFCSGDQIGLLLAAANRDPSRFSSPESFDPVRPAKPITSFGAGVHFCLGTQLAKLEVSLALSALARRCPSLRITGTPEFADRYHFRGLKSLMVTI